MSCKKYFFLFVIIFGVFSGQLFAQHSEPNQIEAFKIQEKIRFDGDLSDSVWQNVKHISNFTQRELNFGEPVSERTEVAVLYDNNALYIGVWCYQTDASEIVAKYMKPDFDYESDDNFQIMLSPFNDNRTGYLFVINPNGARADILIFSGEDGNDDWNGVWDVKTTVNEQGWFAEVVIPFSTLQFKKAKNLDWAINFERDIVSNNEQSLWQGWSRDNSIYAVVNSGKLINLSDISYSKKFELKPYTLVGWQMDKSEGVSFPFRFGADLNVNVSPTLKLNLTSFTDFAQVEADRIPVNLSRFSVYYPEKRQFFLEGYNLFEFYLGERNTAFYTREIGKENGQQVSIIGGARLFGKIGENNIGFLNIQEASVDTVPTTNNTVFRYKRDIGKQSYIGGIFTNKINQNYSNQLFGLDASYQTSEFFKNKNLVIVGKVSTSLEDFKLQDNAFSYRLFVDYPNDLMDIYMSVSSMQKDFSPGLGYIRRSDYDSYTWSFRLTPRWFSKLGVQQMLLKPWGFTFYRTNSTSELESFSNETRPLGVLFKSGERFELNFLQNFDRIDEPFDVTDDISIVPRKYMMYNYELQFETDKSRKLWLELEYNWGDFYDGDIKTIESEIGISFNKHLNFSGSYSYNIVSFIQGKIFTHEIDSYLDYSISTKMNFSFFAQYNSLDEIMIYNLRFHWIPKVGSDFYFVYNIGYEEPIKQIEYLKPQTTSAVMKFVYRITF